MSIAYNFVNLMLNYTVNHASNFCSDKFWDLNRTWYTDIPDFTQCFQHTILVLVPCLCFGIAVLTSLWSISKFPINKFMPWTLLTVLKIILCVVLIILGVLELGYTAYEKHTQMNIPDVNIYSHCTKILTFALALFFITQNKRRGIRSSTSLTIFWLTFSICETVIYRSTLINIFYKDIIPNSPYSYVLGAFYLPALYCQFFFSLYYDEIEVDYGKKRSPLEDAPFFSFLTVHFFNQIIIKGRKKLLTLEDFPLLSPRMHANKVWNRFSLKWSEGVSANLENRQETWYKLLFALIAGFWPWALIATFFQLFDAVLIYFPPLLLDKIINFISHEDYLWKGYLYCILMFFSDMMARICFHVFIFFSGCFALQLKSALNSAVYRKSLKLSTSLRKQYTSGEMVNLIAVDVDKIYDLAFYFTFAFGAPLKIILNVVFLWQYLHASCLAGIFLVFFVVAVSGYVSKKSNVVQEKQMETKDSRLKEMAEILNGIRVLKLYAWEKPFIEKITSIRNKEVALIRIFQLCYAAISFLWACAPFLIAVASFVTYILVDSTHVLTPSIAFVSLNLLQILRYAMLELPQLSADIVQTIVSLKRLNKFLCSEEQKKDSVGDQPDDGNALTIKNANFYWTNDELLTLKGINLSVPKGGFIAVIGRVGSGKSSLLSAILGEMNRTDGTIDLQGKVAYVPQQPWILNRTVKENILFVTDMNKTYYDTIIDSCCLKPDLQILPGGDQTEIGEKGVNLSGGQKHRISLARAVYHNADIYLLDDPLSAVDAHVGKELFEKVLGKNGLLQRKTRILVTHSISVLPYTDFIITMKDGRIQETGAYEDLLNKGGDFAEFIEEHVTSKNGNGAEKELVLELATENPKVLGGRSISTIASLQRSISEESATFKSQVNLIEDEHMEVGEVKRKVFINYARRMSFPILIGILFGYIGQQALEVGSSVWLSKWASDPVPVNGTIDTTLRDTRIGVYVVFGFTQSMASLVGGLLLAYGAAKASKIYHSLMLNCVMRTPMSFFDTTPMGRIISRFGRDMEELDMNIPMELDGFLGCLAASIGTFVVVGWTTPLFLAFLVPILIIYMLLQKLYLITSRQLKRLLSITKSPIYSHFAESIQGVSSIKAYNVEQWFINKLETALDTNIMCNFYWNCSSRWLGFRLYLVGDLIVLIASILAIVSRNTLDAALVGLSLTYALTVVDILNWLVRTGTELENACVSVERIEEYSNLKPEAAWIVSETYPPQSWPSTGKIDFHSYSTRYREGLDLVLQQVSLQISENEKVGIVGRTGAGKSSFALALFRIIEPVDGTINIDGVDVLEIGLHQLRSKLTIIPQDPVLFTGTLRLNLDPNCDYTDKDLWNSLEHAHLKNFVSTLKEGLEHKISEGGGNLSVGQRQLVCLARALLKKTKILILDEATAAVDVETDSLIQNTIRTEFKHHTVITIAHRLNTILDYDKILVMSAGKVAEIGNPSDLMKNPESFFYSMAKDAGLV